jgi:hypothetical protein
LGQKKGQWGVVTKEGLSSGKSKTKARNESKTQG